MDLQQVSEWFKKARLVRFGVLLITAALIGIAITLTARAYNGSKLWLEPTATKSTVVTATLTGVGVIFALLATTLAVMAYWASSGKPDLKINVFSGRDMIFFKVSPEKHLCGPYWEARARIRLSNSAPYAARSPSVEVELLGLAVLNPVPEATKGWELGEHLTTAGIRIFYWYGEGRIVPGKGDLVLPLLDLSGARILSDEEALEIKITACADGIKPYERKFTVVPYTGSRPDHPGAGRAN